MQSIKIEHRSKIECYPSFNIRLEFKSLREYIENKVYIRVSVFHALGFEI